MSWLEHGFLWFAVALVLLARAMLVRAMHACGEPPAAISRKRLRFDLGAVAWLALVLLAARSGVLRAWEWSPPPFLLFILAILLLGLRLAWSPIGDTLIRGLPLWALIGFQGFRLPLELLLHRAYESGVMPVQMSFEGRNFDIASGASAILLALILRRRAVPRAWIWAWNVLGLALLGNIVVIAVLSTPRFQAFGPEHSNTFVADPPYVLLPAVMVLAAWTGHLLVLRVLLRRGALGPDSEETVRDTAR